MKSITVPEDLHRALKVAAAMRGVQIQALVEECLREFLRRNPATPMPLGGGAG